MRCARTRWKYSCPEYIPKCDNELLSCALGELNRELDRDLERVLEAKLEKLIQF